MIATFGNGNLTVSLSFRNGIDRAFGNDQSTLSFKTIKLCYKKDDDKIISEPSLLERMLLKVMGKIAADNTRVHIKENVKKSIAFVT
jgi:hypothetical protein